MRVRKRIELKQHLSILPVFPPPGRSTANLLSRLVREQQIFCTGGSLALEIYDLMSRGWPLAQINIDVNSIEVRLEFSKLPTPTRRLLRSYLYEHERALPGGGSKISGGNVESRRCGGIHTQKRNSEFEIGGSNDTRKTA